MDSIEESLNVYVVTIKDDPEKGAFSVTDEENNVILYLFYENDDAQRFAQLLECEMDDDNMKTQVSTIDLESMEKACEFYGYNYYIFSGDDIVIPPKEYVFV